MLKGILLGTALLGFVGSPASARELTDKGELDVAVLVVRPSPATTEWQGYIGYDGRLFQGDEKATTEQAARLAAKQACEEAVLRSCDTGGGHAIALPAGASGRIAVARCEAKDGRFGTFLGGSVVDDGGARWLALDKARKAGFPASSCGQLYYVDVGAEEGE